MFKEHYNMVKEFQIAFGQPVGMPFDEWFFERKLLRNKLLNEERIELLKEMVDVKYVALGTLVEIEPNQDTIEAKSNKKLVDDIDCVASAIFGEDVFEEAFKRVHESNMSKLVDGKPLINGQNGVYDESKPLGKVLKPDTYKPVDLSDLVCVTN